MNDYQYNFENCTNQQTQMYDEIESGSWVQDWGFQKRSRQSRAMYSPQNMKDWMPTYYHCDQMKYNSTGKNANVKDIGRKSIQLDGRYIRKAGQLISQQTFLTPIRIRDFPKNLVAQKQRIMASNSSIQSPKMERSTQASPKRSFAYKKNQRQSQQQNDSQKKQKKQRLDNKTIRDYYMQNDLPSSLKEIQQELKN